jgi:hypothetical protein
VTTLADLAHACASELVAIDENVTERALLDAVLEAVRRSDVRRAR